MTVSQTARLFVLLVAGGIMSRGLAEENVRRIDFDREIRPILSDTCFKCHGPDEEQRVSELRLDQRDGVFSNHEGRSVVAPGDTAASVLHQRITAADPKQRMPPVDSGRELTPRQIELLTEWIRQGAEWSEHWAFVAPKRIDPPTTKIRNWSRNPIDDFVLARLEREGLRLSNEANRSTLIRRVTLDLTGLPPTLDEVDAFLTDEAPNAFEALVDRLLQSPSYGEHMAVAWLDAARYADTSGYQNDGPRSMWRWRDWVIDSFNSNKRFDQFTIEQLAGDLLENPTLEQRIATGFNRNHRGNAEGGIIPEEYQVEYVVDRVDTTFTVWLGLTMGCARCHDHKYDPIRQKDYYQVFACFNNIPEDGRAIKEGNSPPYVKAPLPEQRNELQSLDEQIQAAEHHVAELQGKLAAAEQEWESSFDATLPVDWSVTDGLISHHQFEGNLTDTIRSADSAFEIHPGIYTARRSQQAIQLDGSSFINAGDTANFGYFDKFTLALWLRPDSPNGTIVSRMTPVEEGDGYYVHLRDGYVQVNLVKRWLDDCIRVESHEALPADQWSHITVVYDGSRVAAGITVYVDGQPFPMDVKLDRINQTFSAKLQPVRIGGGQSPFTGAIDDVRIYARDLSPEEALLLAVPLTVSEILKVPAESRTNEQRQKLTRYFLENHAPASMRDAFHHLAALRQQRREFYDRIPTVMVMQEMATPRETHVLQRGQYDRPGERVEPGVPEAFLPLPANAPRNRLGLARWLVSPEHPLTARVAVNRLWQQFYEHGLAKTSEDFGSQGEPPSHPELLDWLATEFVRNEWDIKALQRLIVTSATYRQASDASTELLSRDPENRLLARGPRRRLPAETIRDQALFVSGLLTRTIGGPSVKPYQPPGLWQEIATDTDYVQSHGEDLYRRSLYTYWKRTVAPPTMVTFDATSREACTVQRSRTNTPLQALALMNDVTFVEAARVFAQRELAVLRDSMADRITHVFRTVTARIPEPEEVQILERRFALSLAAFHQNPDAATQLIHEGEFPIDDQLDPIELAAFTTVTSLILNLDEVITKE